MHPSLQSYSTSQIQLCFALWLTTLLASPVPVFAQQTSRNVPTAAELKKNVIKLSSSTEDEDEATSRLMNTTARQLVAYLKAHELSAKEADNLGLSLAEAATDAAHFKVYTYSYESGGTRGTIHRPVFQWRNAAGQLFAYHSHEESNFYQVHRLAIPGRTMYLLLGIDKGNGQCHVSTAYSVELKGNYLLLGKAFGDSTALELCNVDMQFDARKQQLRLDFSAHEEISYDPGFAGENEDLRKQGYRRKPGSNYLDLQFRNGRFVQP